MNIGWPQGIMIAIVFLNLTRHASKNRLPREDHYDLGIAMANAAILLGLLWWGGFFR